MVFAEMKRDGRMKEVEELLVETQEVLDQHKFYRRMHGVSSFERDTASQSWADQCNYARLLGVDCSYWTAQVQSSSNREPTMM